MGGGAEAIEGLDGRRQRRRQNREAVIDSLISLFEEGVYQPGSAEVAERAGLSPRSLFRYFDDVDDLTRTAIERQLGRARPLLDPGARVDDPTGVKMARLVEARVRLYETIAPAARAARVCMHRHPIVAAHVHESRAYLRDQLARLFGPEIEARPALLPALDLLCSFESYELLRTDQGLSRSATASALSGALGALLDPSRETASGEAASGEAL